MDALDQRVDAGRGRPVADGDRRVVAASQHERLGTVGAGVGDPLADRGDQLELAAHGERPRLVRIDAAGAAGRRAAAATGRDVAGVRRVRRSGVGAGSWPAPGA